MFSSNKASLAVIKMNLIKQNERCDTLLQLGEKGHLQLFRKGVDKLGEKYFKQLGKILEEDKVDLVVISVGSAHSNSQQMPEYAITQQSKTAIINIDPGIEIQELKNIKDNINLYSMPAIIDNKKYPQTYAALNYLIENLTNTGKNVVFTFCTSPFCLLEFKNIIDNNKDAIEKRFTIISAYHDYQAVLVYKKEVTELLTKDNFKKISPALRDIFNGALKTSAELDEIIKKYPSILEYAKIYENLSALTISDIVKSDLSFSPKISKTST